MMNSRTTAPRVEAASLESADYSEAWSRTCRRLRAELGEDVYNSWFGRLELDSVRGIGPDLSSRLLAERSRKPFQDWADLITRIKPMGAAQAQRLSDAGLRIHGLPYAAGRKPAQAAP